MRSGRRNSRAKQHEGSVSSEAVWGEEIRRFPVIPLFVLIVLLIDTGRFLRTCWPSMTTRSETWTGCWSRPAWVPDREKEQVIVQRARDKNSEVSLNNARRNIDSGAATSD